MEFLALNSMSQYISSFSFLQIHQAIITFALFICHLHFLYYMYITAVIHLLTVPLILLLAIPKFALLDIPILITTMTNLLLSTHYRNIWLCKYSMCHSSHNLLANIGLTQLYSQCYITFCSRPYYKCSLVGLDSGVFITKVCQYLFTKSKVYQKLYQLIMFKVLYLLINMMSHTNKPLCLPCFIGKRFIILQLLHKKGKNCPSVQNLLIRFNSCDLLYCNELIIIIILDLAVILHMYLCSTHTGEALFIGFVFLKIRCFTLQNFQYGR